MPPPPNLLTLPLEIRNQIYSYLLPPALHLNLVKDDMDGPLRQTNILRLCRHIHYEVFTYYYATNTFHLDLTEPAYAPNRFVSGTKALLKYIRRVRNLHLVIGDDYYYSYSHSLSEDADTLSDYAREQFEWFLKTVREANNGNGGGMWLTNLVILDYCEPSLPREIARELVERAQKRREVLISLLAPFRNNIAAGVRIESRALSRVRACGQMRETIAPAWDTVVGVSHMHRSLYVS